MSESHRKEDDDTIKLTLSYAIGPQVNLLRWVEPQVLIYPVGRLLALHNIEKSVDTAIFFTKENPKAKFVQAYDVYHDKSLKLLAVAEALQGDVPTSQLSILDLRARGKLMMSIEAFTQTEKIVSVHFEQKKGQMILCTLRSQSEYSAVMIEWSKGKLIASINFTGRVSDAQFNPEDSRVVAFCGVGANGLRMYKIKEDKGKLIFKAFPVIPQFDGEALEVFKWVNAIHVVTIAGNAAFVINMDLQVVLQTLHIYDFTPICLKILSHGFLLGGSDGYVGFWEKTEGTQKDGSDGIKYQESKIKQLCPETECMSIDVLEDQMVVGFENRQVTHLNLSSFFQPDDIKAKGEDEIQMEYLNGGSHSDKITGLDVAAQRQMCLTCSMDRSIRLWNLATKKCETTRVFQDTPIAVALHPFGFLCLAIFNDKIRFFNLMVGEIRTMKEIGLKNGTTAKFSHGGHLVACAHQKGQILIITTRKYQKTHCLKGHCGEVHAMAFSSDDKYLATAGKDGVLYVWNLHTMQRVYEHTSKKTEYTCITYSAKDGGRWIAGCKMPTGGALRMWENDELSVDLALPTNVSLSAVNVVPFTQDRIVLLAATDMGTLWIYPFPLTQSVYEEYGLHMQAPDGDATLSNIGFLDNTLITTGHDASMYFSTIGLPRSEFDQTDIVMINKNDVMQLEDEKNSLRDKVKMLTTHLQTKEQELHAHYKKTIEDATSNDQDEITDLRKRIQTLQEQQVNKDRDNLRIMKSMEKNHLSAAQKLEELYEAKLQYDREKTNELELSYKAQIEQLKEEMSDERKEYENKCNHVAAGMQSKIDEKNKDILKHKDILAYMEHRTDVMNEQDEQEYTFLLEKQKKEHDTVAQEQRVQNHQLRKEQDVCLRGLEAMQKEKEKTLKEQSEAQANIKQLSLKGEELSKRCETLKQEKKERENQLKEKDSRIDDFKQKVAVLKKFKEVLDFKLGEATRNLEPKEQQVKQLEENLSELEIEFVRQMGAQREFDKAIAQKQQLINHLQSEVKKGVESKKGRERYILAFQKEVQSIVQEPDMRKWPALIRELFQEYASDLKEDLEQEEVMAETNQQRRLMETKIRGLVAKGTKTEAACKQDIQRKNEENATLINEVNALRHEKKSLDELVKKLSRKLRDFEVRDRNAALEKRGHNPQGGASHPSLPRMKPITDQPSQTRRIVTALGPMKTNTNAVAGKIFKGPVGSANDESFTAEKIRNLQNTIEHQVKIIEDTRLQNLGLQEQIQSSNTKKSGRQKADT